MPVEMAVERVLTKESKVQAPKDVTCYICLEGDGDGTSATLMRGCACRGESAGFVHVECLTELAMSKEASGDIYASDIYAIFDSWQKCGNCKQYFQGALKLEMDRRFWRHHRSSQDINLRYNSTRSLATCLGDREEIDAANQLLDEASTCVGIGKAHLLELKLLRASMLSMSDRPLEALRLLQAMLPEAKVYTANPQLYAGGMLQLADVLLSLDRYQEAHEAAAEAVAFHKAKYGLEDPVTLAAMHTYAIACTKLDRVEEAKATFEDVLSTQTRVLGREHPYTQDTLSKMRFYGFAAPSG